MGQAKTRTKIPDHCKGCLSHHTGGVADGVHNNWCCHFGKAAQKAVSHCINVGAKRVDEKAAADK